MGVSADGAAGAGVLEADGYRFVGAVEPKADDFDGQGHLNNAATVRLFNDMRVEYVHGRIGSWWPEMIRERLHDRGARGSRALRE